MSDYSKILSLNYMKQNSNPMTQNPATSSNELDMMNRGLTSDSWLFQQKKGKHKAAITKLK